MCDWWGTLYKPADKVNHKKGYKREGFSFSTKSFLPRLAIWGQASWVIRSKVNISVRLGCVTWLLSLVSGSIHITIRSSKVLISQGQPGQIPSIKKYWQTNKHTIILPCFERGSNSKNECSLSVYIIYIEMHTCIGLCGVQCNFVQFSINNWSKDWPPMLAY